jgi:hypothetical protein
MTVNTDTVILYLAVDIMDNSGGKTREASDRVEYDFYFTEHDFCTVWSRVLIFSHCPIKLIYLW